MELWQLDVMGGIWLVDGRELKAVTGIDDHSRFCVMAGLIERANTASVCRVFTQALARYGTPEEVLTDNGKVFTGRLGPHPAEVLFDRICRQRGITHRLTGIRAPTTTGKIERFHKTLRAELLTGRRFGSLAQAQQVLDAWVADYNSQRPHQAIAMAVPARRFQPPTAATTPTPIPAAPSPAPHHRSHRGHPPGLGQRPHRGLLPADLSRPASRRPGRHRPAPPDRAPGLLRRPAGPHPAPHQHQGGRPTPPPPTPPAQTTTHNHAGVIVWAFGRPGRPWILRRGSSDSVSPASSGCDRPPPCWSPPWARWASSCSACSLGGDDHAHVLGWTIGAAVSLGAVVYAAGLLAWR
jgi:hypothetical protein